MPPLLANSTGQRPVHLVLRRDLTRGIKAGHPWIYADSLDGLPAAPPGSLAVIKTKAKAGVIVAKGMYDPSSPLAFRVLAVRDQRLDEQLIEGRLSRAVDLRRRLFDDALTTGYRLVNGEGDGLPGLVIDVYSDTAVIKLDGDGPAAFYSAEGLAAWLRTQLDLQCVYLKNRSGAASRGRALLGGEAPGQPVRFLEHGLSYEADVVQGQKTGFFLDQRENRRRMQAFSRGKRVLNLFAYTGGFSVAAGAAGAAHVTSVDVAAPALGAAETNWELNGLQPRHHTAVAADAFAYLEAAASAREVWDVVICDPPSFAPNKAAIPAARSAYTRLFAAAAGVTARGGILALASCSSHVDSATFDEVCGAALGRAGRSAAVLGVHGQPADHPYPLACPELRYLKFVTHLLDC